jgi:sugar phosphate isomerase/epimerase
MKTSATVTLQFDTIFSPFTAGQFADSLRWLEDSGFHGAEICISDPRQVDPVALASQLKNRGLAVSTISTGQARTLEGLSLTDPKAEVREKTVDRIRDHIRLASKIDCPAVTIGLLRGLGTPGNTAPELALLAETLAPCADYGRDNGVRLMIEPINRYETTLLNTAEETLAFIDLLGNPPSVGVLFDVFHANIEEKDICQSIAALGGKLFHVHFADSNRWLPGMGHIDFAAVVRSLRSTGFNGYVSLEAIIRPDRDTVIRDSGRRLAACLK